MSCLPKIALPSRRVPVTELETQHGEEMRAHRGHPAFRILIASVLLVMGGIASAVGQSLSPYFSTPVPVGRSATATVIVTATQAGSVDTVEVLTQGAPGIDFSAATSGPSCASASLSPGQTCQQVVTFAPAYPGTRVGAVVLLSGGKAIGTTYLSGVGQGGLPVLVNGNMIPVAGSGAWEEVEDGQPATQADLNLPASVVLDGAGNLYIADSIHNRIRMVSSGKGATIAGSVSYPAAGIITTIAGTGIAAAGPDDVAAYSSALNSPSGLALDGTGNLYVADTGNDRVRMISAATGEITTIAPGAGLNQPWGVTVDASGNLFIADTFNHRVVRVDGASHAVTTVAGDGTQSVGATAANGDGGLATAAQLNRPHAVAFDAAGAMYIPDTGDNRIRKVDSSGIITTIAGTGVVGFSPDGTAAASAAMWAPSAVLVDAAQNLYISDSQNNAVRKVNAATGRISTVVQNGKLKYLYNNAASLNAIYGPMGLALDSNGNLYVADYYYMRVREIQSSVGLLDFTAAAVRAGSMSTQAATPAFLQVENDGNAPITLDGIAAVSNAAVDVSTTCQAGDSLAVNAACKVVPLFAPTTSGNPMLGEVDITDTAANAPLAIRLIGDATPINSTTTTLTSNHDPANYGQSVTFTATVNTGAGTGSLTGTVTLFDGTTPLQTGLRVAPSSIPNTYTATFSTPSLSVGVHSITATYSGDTYHLATDPTMIPQLTQVINEATAVTIASSANPAALGSSIILTGKVSISGGGGVTPDGSLNFLDGSTLLGSGGLDMNGVASITISTLTPGSHSITANYAGDAGKNILASASSVLKQDVQAASTTAVQATPNPSTYGSSVSFTATVTSSSGSAPTGTVTFSDGATKLGTATILGTSGIASFTTATLSAGSHAVTASYAGDTYSGPGVSAPIIVVVNLISTVTSVAASPAPGIAGKPVSLTATVKPVAGTGAITGNVVFSDGTKALGSSPVNASGVASISPTLAPGAHAIVTSYSGDSNDTASTSVALPLAVNLATTAVGVQSSASPSTVFAPVAFTAKVTGNGGLPTGKVTFSVDGATVNTADLDPTGAATFSTAALNVGSHHVTASYSGDTNDAGSVSAAFTQAVQPITTIATLGQSATSGNVPELILVAAITTSSGPVPTGTVTFVSGTQTLGAATLDSTGVATLVPNLSTGDYQIVANYLGDENHSPSTSPALKVSGTPVGFGISIDPASITLSASQNTTVNVNVSSNNGFADTIGFGCGTMPAGVTCHFASPNVQLKAGESAVVQLTIDTNNPLAGGATARMASPDRHGLDLAGIFLPTGVLFGLFFRRFRRRNSALLGVFLAVLMSGALALSGCGGFSQSTAAPGKYTIAVTGVGAHSNITHFQNITLTINK